MSISVNKDGIWREVTNSMVCINGVWRSANQWGKINGVWRTSNPTKRLKPDDIKGFRLIYTLDKSISYTEFPGMKFNPDIKNIIAISEHTSDGSIVELNNSKYDESEKGIIFEIVNTRDYGTEGIYALRGILYAELIDGTLVSISDINDNPTSNTDDVDIKIDGYVKYESYGPKPIIGWNRMLSYDNILPVDSSNNKKLVRMNSYNILPSYKRASIYDSSFIIGIARNMSDKDHNMIGTTGLLDQTIESIYLNGTEMPFSIEYHCA